MHDDVAWAAANHRPVVAEQRARDDILENDGESCVEVGVGGGCGETVAQAQLLNRLRRSLGRHLFAPADDVAPKE